MPTERKYNLFCAFPSYGGNGGVASEHPDIRRWFSQLILKLKNDPRIGNITELTTADTPITMVRNQFVVKAREAGADILLMVDSDMSPSFHEKEAGCKPFWDSSFDFFCSHFDKGPCVIGAPYCGPPGMIGSENMYVFGWDPSGSHGKDETCFSLEQIPRMMAARMRGIQPAAALPTGCILYDARAFKLIEPLNYTRSEVLEDLIQGKITKNVALSRLHQGWFYYEWTNNFACEKASTEDVTNTRDISLAGCTQLGYNPVYCNWDAPVGHWKPWCVRGRPFIHQSEQVAETYRRALEAPIEADEILVDASQYNHEMFINDQKKD